MQAQLWLEQTSVTVVELICFIIGKIYTNSSIWESFQYA